MSPTDAAAAPRCASICLVRAAIASASIPAGARFGEERGEPVEQHVRGVVAGLRQHVLAVHAGLNVGAAQFDVDLLLDVVGRAFLDHQHRALAGAEIAHFFRHQRVDAIEHADRHAGFSVESGEVEPRQRAQHARGQPAADDDADVGKIAGDDLVELVLADEGAGGGQAVLDLEPLMHEQRGRVREARILEAGRAGDAIAPGERGAAIVLRREFAGDMTGADAQLHHHRRVARFGQLEALFHHAHDGRQIGPRIEQPHRGFQRVGVGAFLDHAGALAVVLAEDDHHAADHAGRRKVRERVGRDIGADDRLPGDGAAQRIVDRCAQHGGRRRFVGAGLDVHAKLGEQVLGLDHDVEQVRYRRALVAADIAHAGLQQRLGDREDAFAAEHVAVAELQRFHFLLERAFHGSSWWRRLPSNYYKQGCGHNLQGMPCGPWLLCPRPGRERAAPACQPLGIG